MMGEIENEPTIRKYWAYRHVNGHIKVKLYHDEFGKDEIDQAEESPFVDYVLGPYVAENRQDAERIALEKLRGRP
jgi:hypothetical protein